MQYLANGNSQKSDLMKKLLCNWICKWRGWSPKCAQREWVQGDQPNQNKMEWRYPNHLNMLACKWQWSLTSQNLLYQKTGLAEYEPPTVWGDCHQSFCAAFYSYCVFALSYAKTLLLFFFFLIHGVHSVCREQANTTLQQYALSNNDILPKYFNWKVSTELHMKMRLYPYGFTYASHTLRSHLLSD